MYIAICDNEASQRKHLERLLGRESDLRLKSNIVMYIESYGLNFQSSISAILKYDVFLINVAQQKDTITTITNLLQNAGSTAPIYFYNCSPKYANSSSEQIHFITNYLDASSISSIVDTIWNTIQSKEPRIEVRTEEHTMYLVPNDIITIKKNDFHVDIQLINENSLHVHEQLDYYLDLLSNYPNFFLLGHTYICNRDFITSISFRNVILQEKHKVPLSFIEYFQLKSWLK